MLERYIAQDLSCFLLFITAYFICSQTAASDIDCISAPIKWLIILM